MRPNTPHFVVTPESAICHGGHFYAMSTIQDTVFGIYHTFVAGRNITNTEHTEDACLLLQRLIIHIHNVLVKCSPHLNQPAKPAASHIPNVSTFQGVVDLFMLCIVMELGDLINPLAYWKKYQCNHDRDYNWLCIIHACGMA